MMKMKIVMPITTYIELGSAEILINVRVSLMEPIVTCAVLTATSTIAKSRAHFFKLKIPIPAIKNDAVQSTQMINLGTVFRTPGNLST